MNIEQTNKLTGEILSAKERCDSLSYKIELMEKPEAKISARLDLEINNNRRSSTTYYLSIDDVLPILKKELIKTQSKLTELEAKYAGKS